MTVAEAVRLDVRAMLASGGEPLALILETAERIPAGSTFELTAPFDPVPLYPVLRLRGFVGQAQARSPGEWVVTFRNSGIVPARTLTEIVTAVPAAGIILARQGLDLCCGGSKTLAFATQAHGLDLDALLAELQAASLPDQGG
jgi:hypothetical protein